MAQGTDIAVLHVDDDPDFAELTATYLQREDDRIVVETATSAVDGLARLSEIDVDCIVSEYDMPGRDGIEFFEAVREDHSEVPFILFTGKGSEAVASRAISAGITDYLQKQGGTSQYVLLANKIVNAVDTTRSRERAEAVSRIREILREINQDLVRARSREAIESAVCRTISQVDPYRLAWIGVDEGDSGQQIHFRASAGDATGYLEAVPSVIEATDATTAPVRRAFRDRELATTQSIPVDPSADTWQTLAREYDIRGVAAIPLLYEDTLYGVLTVYSGCAEFIDDRERDLLVELGQDVAHAIHRVESERELREQRADLRLYEHVVESSSDLLAGIDREYTLIFANERYREFHGIGADDVGDLPLPDVLGDQWDAAIEQREEAVLNGNVLSYEIERAGPDGEPRTFSVRDYPLRDDDGTIIGVVGSMRDITKRTERERELRRLKERLDLAVDAAGIGIWDWDVRTDTVQFNDQWATMLESSPADIDSHIDAWEARVHPDDLPAAREKFQAHLSGETADFDDELRVRTDDDSWLWIRCVGRLVDRDEQGDPIRAVGINLDIDERKQREQALAESECRYRSLFESNPAVVWVEDFSAVREYVESLRGEVDDVQAYIEANPAEVHTILELVEILDVSAEAVDRYGAPSKEALMANVDELFTPEAYAANAELWRRLADGETHFRVQTVAQTFDGDRMDEILDVRVPDANADDYSRVYLTAIDVTDRERREQKLEALHDVATALQACESAEYVYDRTIEASEEILEFDLSAIDIEADGTLRTVALSADAPENATAELSVGDGVVTETYRTGESLLVDDVQTHPAAHSQGPFRSRISVPIGEHGVFQAVAEQPGAFDESDLELAELLVSHAESALDRLEHERRLERHNERLAEFASIVSHDLRNPLSVARGNVELLAQEYDAGALDTVMDAHERMETLIDDLLGLTLERDRGIDIETLDLGELAERCWETVATADATLVLETEQAVRADRSQLQHVLQNLFGNAVEHGSTSPDSQVRQDAVEHGGGAVTVTVGDLEDGFYVADDGPGISADERSTVFDVGYSTDDGTGYGLAIVERAVDVHGWEIAITESHDGGARFEITGVAVE
ncbi:GAF domain-containing protein [Halorhabdus rudnickae]|uniref:GAF domain-containing protein n=1 Tax=Halorhabdus rudnickae TaxID=1775544 RepID=UPI001AEF76C6|nr:GAF domain-containing protein [Halorhabdus rudnickae]